MKINKLAIIYDFDKTLSPKDMQEFHYLKSIGFDNPNDFWEECGKIANKHNCDSILSYMYCMLKFDLGLDKQKLLDEGKYIELFKGVDTWFKRINDYGKTKGINVEHYIISSGLEDVISGTSIAKEFKQIYACQYIYDKYGKALWPSRVINYTLKTQYLFRINNGVFNEKNDVDLNKSTPDKDKYLPFENMIYIGDGLTDVPSMKVVSQNNGTAIAVYNPLTQNDVASQLKQDKRVDFICEANYSSHSKIEKIVKNIIDQKALKLKISNYK